MVVTCMTDRRLWLERHIRVTCERLNGCTLCVAERRLWCGRHIRVACESVVERCVAERCVAERRLKRERHIRVACEPMVVTCVTVSRWLNVVRLSADFGLSIISWCPMSRWLYVVAEVSH